MLEKMINVLKQFIIGLCVFIYMLASRYQATPLILLILIKFYASLFKVIIWLVMKWY